MPLKLLGKKSWHVYNADNIARVRRDEAEARAREAEEEREQRAAESAQREALLRGEAIETADDAPEQANWRDAARALQDEGEGASTMMVTRKPSTPSSSMRRPRKRHGEDDTDYEMRLARSHAKEDARRKPSAAGAAPATELSLVDRHGHIDLFGQEEREGRTQRIQRSQYIDPALDAPSSSMRLADAAGGRDALSAWYAGEKGPTPASKPSFSSPAFPPSDSGKPRKPPIPAPVGSMGADPLMAMRQGAAAVRALKQERQREVDERNQAMAALVAEQAREKEQSRDRERKEHRRRKDHRRRDRRRSVDDDVDSLEGFALDDVRGDNDKDRQRHAYRDRQDSRDAERRHHRDRDHRRHRSDRDHERSRHHHRHHSRDCPEIDSSHQHRCRSQSRSRDRTRRANDTQGRERRHGSSLSPRRSRGDEK